MATKLSLKKPEKAWSSPKTAQPQAQPVPRTRYQERLEQLKAQIIELSNRNFDYTLRMLRTWLKKK